MKNLFLILLFFISVIMLIVGVRCLNLSQKLYNESVAKSNTSISVSDSSGFTVFEEKDTTKAFSYVEPDKFTRPLNDSILKVLLNKTEKEIENIKPFFESGNYKRNTWIRHRNISIYGNELKFHTAIDVEDSGRISLQLGINYYGDSLMFVDKISIKTDNSTFWVMGKMARENDLPPNVFEWLEIEPDADQLLMLWTIAEAKTSRVRFEGSNHYKNWTLTHKEIKALKDTLLYYRLLIRKSRLEKQLKK